MPKYSIIVPVYNRPEETRELLESLAEQNFTDFELLLIEDGSERKSDEIAKEYSEKIDINYFFKENTGPGDSRNFGMHKAKGAYFLFFDSDCVLPDNYLIQMDKQLSQTDLDAYGGPDAAHKSFTNTQKAINYAMTSFFTTGGIRGGKKQLDTFQPRSFNMGFSRRVYETVGGFGDIHPGEDPDLSYRIMSAGFKVGLISEAYVYHKRRIDFSKYLVQVYKFGVVRGVLNKWHPSRKSLVFFLPTLFLLGSLALLFGALRFTPNTLIPFAIYATLILVDAGIKTKSLPIALMSIMASFIQLYGYGLGFLKSFLLLFIFRADERKAFNSFFFVRSK